MSFTGDAREVGASAIDAVRSGLAERVAAVLRTPPDVVELAVVFTDLEGFTRHTSEVGDEQAAVLLAEHHRAVGPVVRSWGGRIIKRLGDGYLLTFPEPVSAVRAAVELLDTAPEPLRLRAGVSWGQVVDTHADVIGHLVNVAARVTESAKGGEVLVTAAVHEQVRDEPGLSFGRLRRQHYKGVDGPIRVSRVTPAPVPAPRP